ncbi:uncharacterized protein EI90DRAFT_3062659 [Cantharellus anzutake]|uniref:uncharacterized protein n=1 Tax=Cantharellus anzutake TaxID=1750568 RepID=UPI0019036646|nr:uncharacterized protein EI90DRAFT_3062659 [Cantharellus anzutake]KAF8329451.1 hypothetical protein EI90DRAFT_3062659 [Cantharellus anzutake]
MSNEPSENWDDDFEFQPNEHQRSDYIDDNARFTHNVNHRETTASRSTNNYLMPNDYSDNTTHSRFSINSAAWDDPEPGPSKLRLSTHITDVRAHQPNLTLWSEEADHQHNYDHDFGLANHGDDLDQTVTNKGTSRSHNSTPPQPSSSISHHVPHRPCATDGMGDSLHGREFGDATQAGSSIAHARSSSVASTSSRHHLKGYQTPSSSSLNLTSHFMLRNRSHTPDPLPLATSPTLSTFSSPSHMAVSFATSSRPLITPPPTSPPRPRRRLRKKSRPQDFDPNAANSYSGDSSGLRSYTPFSCVDEDEDQPLFDDIPEERVSGTITPLPVRTKSPSPRLISNDSPATFPVPMPSSPPTKTPLLSRISSVKRWRSRRSSQTSKDFAGDISVDSGTSIPYQPPKTPEPSFSRAVTPASPSTSRNWLFRTTPSPNSKPTPDPGLHLSNSNSAYPTSRFRKRSSTTAGAVYHEDQEGHDLKGKKKRSSGIVSRVLGISNHTMTDVNLTPKQSRTTLRHTDGDLSMRRPLSLQAQPRLSARNAPVGRSSSKPFVTAGSKENSGSDHSSGGRQSLDLTKKRVPSFNSLKHSGHQRSISLTSDPDEPSYGRAAVTSILETPPPVPPLPSSVTAMTEPSLLPPINLSPPSPPRNASKPSWSPWAAQGNELLAPSTPPKAAIQALANSSLLNRIIGKKGSAPPSPGQSFSLGRAMQHNHGQLLMDVASAAQGNGAPVEGSTASLPNSFSSTHLRRSSLGDLKIPPRISMAQTGLRSNLVMVREFANKIDELQKLCDMRAQLLIDLKHSDDTLKVSSPRFLWINPDLQRIEEQYALWWECAELLVDLGGTGAGRDQEGHSTTSASTSAPPALLTHDPTVLDEDNTLTVVTVNNRERAITLTGGHDPSSMPPSPEKPSLSPNVPAWRASTGRHDLSTRQLTLLRDMLETPDPAIFNRLHTPTSSAFRSASQPNQASASAITLPSIPSSPAPATAASLASGSSSALDRNEKPVTDRGRGKSHQSRKTGLVGIRDILRLLTNRPPLPSANGAPPSSCSSRSEVDLSASRRLQHRKRKSSEPQNSVGPSAKQHPRIASPCHDEGKNTLNFKEHRKSPRRPSLASIFRIGQSHANVGSNPVPPLGQNRRRKFERRRRAVTDATSLPHPPPYQGNNASAQLAESITTEEEEYSDWDRIDSASDLEIARSSALPRATLGTLKGRVQPPSRAEESGRDVRTPIPARVVKNDSQVSFADRSSVKPSRETTHFDPGGLRAFAAQSPTVRSAPPKIPGLGEGYKLALTPENIRPLLEYAKEVGSRVGSCVEELKELKQLRLVEIAT